MRTGHALILALALSLPAGAQAHDYTAGALEIIHPAMPAPPRAGGTAAGYLTIVNHGTTPDRLVGVESALAERHEVHRTEEGADGVARMVHVPVLEIPPGERVALEPGGLHVMFMGLTERPAVDSRVGAVLVFEEAGRVEVEFAVEPAAGGGGHGAHHGH